jgi:hypothetical protein
MGRDALTVAVCPESRFGLDRKRSTQEEIRDDAGIDRDSSGLPLRAALPASHACSRWRAPPPLSFVNSRFVRVERARTDVHTGGLFMHELEFHDPSGAIVPTAQHARRLDRLDGKRIGFVSIDEWQAYRTFPLLAELLKADFADIELLPVDAYPRGIGPVAGEELATLVARSGVDAVIVGNAA